jgi:hypothetical protein
VTLRKLFTARKHELEQPTKPTPPAAARVPRLRTRGSTAGIGNLNGQSLSAMIAALRGESEDEDTANAEPDEESQTDTPVL